MTDYSDVAKLYNETAAKWDRDEPTYRSDFEARPKLVELAAELKPKRILDLGCGEGYVTRMLRKAMPTAIITGIDISQELIKIARRKSCNEMYILGNMTNLERWFRRGQFDLITAAFSTHYLSLEDHARLFKDAAEIGKHMIITTMDPKTHWECLPCEKTTYENDEGKMFTYEMPRQKTTATIMYVHRTRERMEEDFLPFKIQKRILIPCREANFDFIVYQLGA